MLPNTALAPGVNALVRLSDGVNLNPRAEIPAGSVTVHACMMMPEKQVTLADSCKEYNWVASCYISSELHRMEIRERGTVIK